MTPEERKELFDDIDADGQESSAPKPIDDGKEVRVEDGDYYRLLFYAERKRRLSVEFERVRDQLDAVGREEQEFLYEDFLPRITENGTYAVGSINISEHNRIVFLSREYEAAEDY